MRAIKKLLLPPAGNLLAAVALLPLAGWAETAEPARWALVFDVALLYLLATPIFGVWLLRRLAVHHPVDPRHLPADAALVVLDAGCHPGAAEWSGGTSPKAQTLERLRYAAYLQKRSKLPLLVSGDGAGATMADFVREELGAEVAWIEDRSRNTEENARQSAELVRAEAFGRVVLVSHFWHLPRAVAAFRRQGLEVLPAPMGFFTLGRHERSLAAFLPSIAGLTASYWALHELLGLAYYRLRYRPRPAAIR